MSPEIPKRRVRLDSARYRQLKKEILVRDGWKCQYCGRRDQLQIHHMIRRSQSGADSEENLIVLCSCCHGSLHQSRPAHDRRKFEPPES